MSAKIRGIHSAGHFLTCRGSCSAVPDTGTTRTIVRADVLAAAGISYDPSGAENVTTANGSAMPCLGNAILSVQLNDICLPVDALVSARLDSDILVSWRDLQRYGIISPRFPAREHSAERAPALSCSRAITPAFRPPGSGFPATDSIDAVLAEYADVFDETQVSPMTGAPMKIQMRRHDPAYKPIRVAAPRRVPLHFQSEADKDLQWFLSSGVIVPVPEDEHTEWCSPGFFVPKPNGKVRLVVDYRAINKFIDRPVHPFPSPRDVVRGILPSSRYFMKLDAVQGYYQVPLDEESSRLTTFLLPSGRYRFMRAPMGMNSSSDGFCMRTDYIFRTVPKVQKIVDDALLQADSMPELVSSFRTACEAARKNNLTLSQPKLKYGPQIEFAGYIISADGVKPDPRRTEAISAFPPPTDLSSLRGFLGLVNQLGFFVPDLAHMTNPLRLLLKKGIAWIWLPEHQAAFEEVKRALLSSLLVQPFDPALKTELLTDASRLKGLGYALIQRDCLNNIRLVQCSSRSLSSAETRYATIELECLAIQWAIEDCRYYLLGCEFRVLTDHRPLVGVFEKPLADLANTRLLRIRLKLTDYRMSVEWTPGKTHCIADALSRSPVFDPPETPSAAHVRSFRPTDPCLNFLIDAAAADTAYQAVISALRSGVAEHDLPPDHPAATFRNLWSRMAVRDELLLTLDHDRIIIPYAARREILSRLHLSHPGCTRMLQLARSLYHWPGMKSDIISLVARCEACQLTRASKPHTAAPRAYPPALFPLHYVSLDLFACAGKEYLLMVDRYSGFTWVSPLTRETTAAVVKPLLSWFHQIGFPEHILSDNGPCFRSDFKSWCATHGIIPDNSSPYHSESNGLAEVAVQRVKRLLEKCASFSDFQARHFEMRNVPSAGVATSPSQRFFGRTIRGCLPVLSAHRENVPDSASVPDFAVGDRVRLQNPISKLWDEKGTISAIRESGNSFLIARDIGGQFIRNRRFLKRLPRVHIRFEPDLAALPASDMGAAIARGDEPGALVPPSPAGLGGADTLEGAPPASDPTFPRRGRPRKSSVPSRVLNSPVIPLPRRSPRLNAVLRAPVGNLDSLGNYHRRSALCLQATDRAAKTLSHAQAPLAPRYHVPCTEPAREAPIRVRSRPILGFPCPGDPRADGLGLHSDHIGVPAVGRGDLPLRSPVLPVLALSSASSSSHCGGHCQGTGGLAGGLATSNRVASRSSGSSCRLAPAAVAASEPAFTAASGTPGARGPASCPPLSACKTFPRPRRPGPPSCCLSSSGPFANALQRSPALDTDSVVATAVAPTYADVLRRPRACT